MSKKSFKSKPLSQLLQKIKSRKRSSSHEGEKKLPWRQAMVKQGVKWGIVLCIWAMILLVGALLYFAHDLPDISTLGDAKKVRKVTILSEQGEVLANYGDLYAEYTHYDHIPKILIEAVLATEDRRFFHHFGIDPIGLMRAFYTNYQAGRVVQGGSTITQQLAKILFLSSERTLKRKAQEAMLALYLERRYTKEEILTIYLNRVYMGAGIYGVSAAAKYYFGKPLQELTLYEAALIAGLLKAPSRYSPTNSTDRANQRAQQILINMVDAGMITEEEQQHAKQQEISLETSALGSLKHLYFADWVMEQIPQFINNDEIDLVVRTTLDPSLQAVTEAAIERALLAEGEKFNVRQGAGIILSPTGEVRAMVGGRNYTKSPFNRATKALRQPGSAFKLFVYAAAFENGISPDEEIMDGPITIHKWRPRNYDNKHLGMVTVREAFCRSVNTVAVQLSERVGRGEVIRVAQELGINSALDSHPSLALGSVEVTLLELTGGYASVANAGRPVWPHAILEIKDTAGKTLYARKEFPHDPVISPYTINALQDIMQCVVENGTGRRAMLDRPAAGKTGTTSDFRDALFIGFTADYVAGVWIGNDNNQSMKKVTGGTLPASIWKEIMLQAHLDRPVRPLPYMEANSHSLIPSFLLPKKHNSFDNKNTKTEENFWNDIMNSLEKDTVEYRYPEVKRR